MKLNRNKKILLTLGGILIVFGLYKYFGNVVEGYEDSYLQMLRNNIKGANGALDMLKNDLTNNTEEYVAARNQVVNLSNIEGAPVLILKSIDDLKKIAKLMFPTAIIEGMTKKQKNAKKAAAAEKAAAKRAVDAAAAEKTAAINEAINAAITSFSTLDTLHKTVISENPYSATTMSKYTPKDLIIVHFSYSIDTINGTLQKLKEKQGIK